jgi:hypothetical protein
MGRRRARMRPVVKCTIKLRSALKNEVPLTRAYMHLSSLLTSRGYDSDIESELVPYVADDDTEWLNAIRASGFPGKAKDLLTLPMMEIVVGSTKEYELVKKTIPASKLRSSKVFDPLMQIILGMVPTLLAEASVMVPSPAAGSPWRFKPANWVEPKTHGPGATTCYCRRMARKVLTSEMRAGVVAGPEPALLPDLSDDDVGRITEILRIAMRGESALGMQLAITKDYGKTEQAAYYTGVRLANHTAALKVIKTFPGSNRAAELAKELDPWSDY